MKQEFDWDRISEITAKRTTCIGPARNNYEKARDDFRNNPDRVKYYTFFWGKGIGYLRTITEQERIYVDFISPWGSVGNLILKQFAKYVDLPVYINEKNAWDELKALTDERIAQVNVGDGIAHRTYTAQDSMAVRIAK